jgi:D-glycero-D-manno-heptose 1,7-bisphosphate phosphatase
MFHSPHDTQILIFPASGFRTGENSLPAGLNFIRGKTLLEHQIIEFYKCGFRNFLLLSEFETEIVSRIIKQISQKFQNLQISIVNTTNELNLDHFHSRTSGTYLKQTLLVPDNIILQFLRSEIETYFESSIGSKSIRFNQTNSDSNANQKEMKTNSKSNLAQALALFLSSDSLRKLLKSSPNPEDIVLSFDKNLENITLSLQGYVFMSSHTNSKLENYLDSSRQVVFLDRDGTLNKKLTSSKYIKNPNDFIWKKKVKNIFLRGKKVNREFFIITNQAGVSNGFMDIESVNLVNLKMQKEALIWGIGIKRVFICIHSEDQMCNCRKPKVGLFLRAQFDHDINLRNSFFVGDDPKDRLAGYEVGVDFAMVESDSGNLERILKKWKPSSLPKK